MNESFLPSSIFIEYVWFVRHQIRLYVVILLHGLCNIRCAFFKKILNRIYFCFQFDKLLVIV